MNASSPWVYEEEVREDNRRNPPWMLVTDPDNTMVIGGCFYQEDIANHDGKVVWSCWLPGTKFQNIHTGEIIEVFEKITYKQVRDTIVTEVSLRYKKTKPSDQLEMEM